MKIITIALLLTLSSARRHHPRHHSLQMLRDDPICSSAGCTQYKFPKSKAAEEVDYSSLPHFGADPEVEDTFNSLNVAQRNLKHTWVFGDKQTAKKYHNVAKDVLYDDAPDLDSDIKDSQQNL